MFKKELDLWKITKKKKQIYSAWKSSSIKKNTHTKVKFDEKPLNRM